MIGTILLIAAVICFIVDALGLTTRVNLTAVGLACFAGSFLV